MRDNCKKDGARKSRDEFATVVEKIVKDKESGNQSGKSGELSNVYKLVEQVVYDKGNGKGKN
jgi:hypothetical protein